MRFMTFHLTLHSKKQLPRQKWNFRSGTILRPMFPSTRCSIGWLRFSDKAFPYSLLPEKDLKILRKKRLLPYFSSGWCRSLRDLNLPKRNYNMKDGWEEEYSNFTMGTLPYFYRILKESKNLKSLTLKVNSWASDVKKIRKARSLQDLSLEIMTKSIVDDPQLFQRFTFLQKLKLYIRWSKKDYQNALIKKFFDFVIHLPKLQHLTIWIEEESYDPFNPSSQWLSGDFNYYRTLLPVLHKAKIPSFEIIVVSDSTPPNSSKLSIDWGNLIDTLFIGPIVSLRHQDEESNDWPLTKKPERRLKLHYPHYNSGMDKLFHESIMIKNLTLECEFCEDKKRSARDAKSLLKFLSQIKALENLTMTLDVLSKHAGDFISGLSQNFSQIESLQSLTTLTLDFNNRFRIISPISPPYGKQMKNIKTLSLNILGCSLDLSLFTKALKDLGSLENLNFDYAEFKPYSRPKELDCNFSFRRLKNLKSISLKCDIPFSENARKQLIKSISEVKNLESLNIGGEIFNGLSKKEASELTENLCLKKNLEVANFSWKGSQWIEVSIKKVDGKIVACSVRKEYKIESDDDEEDEDDDGDDDEEGEEDEEDDGDDADDEEYEDDDGDEDEEDDGEREQEEDSPWLEN